MKALVRKIIRSECGATAIEYGLLISLIGLGAVIGMRSFVDALYKVYETVNANTVDSMKN